MKDTLLATRPADTMAGMTIADTHSGGASATAAQRFSYGADPEQFGELRLPAGSGPFPTLVYVHGGGWNANVTLAGAAGVCAALTERGYATWSIEYRRIGNGGGWPTTFEDVTAAAAHLKVLAQDAPLDLSRVFVGGQSAGGQLALWLAKQRAAIVPAFRGVVALAPATNLRATVGNNAEGPLPKLLGGLPDQVSDRYAAASPVELLPLGLPQILVHGTTDSIVPYSYSQAYVAAARQAGDDVELVTIEGAEHLDLWNVQSAAFPRVIEAATRFLARLS